MFHLAKFFLLVWSSWVSARPESVFVLAEMSHGLYSPRDSPGQDTGVGSLSLLQGMFPTQGANPGLPHCKRILYRLSPQGKPRISLVETNSWVIPQIWNVCPESYHPRHWDNEPRETHGSWAFTHPHSSMDLALSCSKQANPSDGIHGGPQVMDRWMV